MSLLLKIILTPLLIGLASSAGRRWGPSVSGWLVGLPFTTGPITFFLALDHGTHFAAAAAAGTLTGTISEAVFCLAYGGCAFYLSWPLTALMGCLAFAIATYFLRYLTLPLALLSLVVVAVLVIALRLMHSILSRAKASSYDKIITPPRWNIPVRMLVATVFVVLLTGVAPALGPHLAGLLAPFPLYGTILALFAHQQQGPIVTAEILWGLLLGQFAFASFFLMLALLLPQAGIAPAFLVALVLALIIQAGALVVLRRS